MPNPIFRYGLDPTGTDANNLVSGEILTLSNLTLRAAVPRYGPVFAESLVIFDNLNNTQLVRNVDYKLIELVQSATAKFGKEIISSILVTNETISSEIRLNYQVLGGLYQFDDSSIKDMYDTYLNDNRGVDWSNVLNKPLLYPPSLHNHLLEDVYGFEPVIVALERIRNSIAATDLPAYQAMVDWVMNRVNISTEEDIRLGNSNANLVTNERLIQALSDFNFNSITIDPLITTATEGSALTFNLRTTNYPNNTVLYWTVVHGGTDGTDFVSSTGLVHLVNNRGSFIVNVVNNAFGEGDEDFTVLIRKNDVNGFILARSPRITIGAHGVLSFVNLVSECCLYNPNLAIDPYSYFITESRN